MRDGEGLHGNPLHGKLTAGLKDPPPLESRHFFLQDHGGAAVAVDGGCMVLGPLREALRMISVLMGDQDAVEFRREDAAGFQAPSQFPGAQPCIHQERGVAGAHKGRIAGASAGEDGDFHHPRSMDPSDGAGQSFDPPFRQNTFFARRIVESSASEGVHWKANLVSRQTLRVGMGPALRLVRMGGDWGLDPADDRGGSLPDPKESPFLRNRGLDPGVPADRGLLVEGREAPVALGEGLISPAGRAR